MLIKSMRLIFPVKSIAIVSLPDLYYKRKTKSYLYITIIFDALRLLEVLPAHQIVSPSRTEAMCHTHATMSVPPQLTPTSTFPRPNTLHHIIVIQRILCVRKVSRILRDSSGNLWEFLEIVRIVAKPYWH